MIHRQQLECYPGSLDELARDIGDLRYDALAIFLRALAAKLARDAAADAGRGRPKLAASLEQAASAVADAASHIDTAWTISAPHML